MYDEALTKLVYISQAVGNPLEYTQGGGGNTSVKLNDELMAVKASGYKLKQISANEGYVVVNYKRIKEYYEKVDLSVERDYEKESIELVKSNIMDMEGLKRLRPSVEAGFHSIMKKFVIHTHPVYANILCCCENGRELTKKIFSGKEYSAVWIPYINPGFCLTLKINDAIKSIERESGRFPEVIFMENHGLVITSDVYIRCVGLHKEVNDTIKNYLGITETYPSIELFTVDDNTIVSKTEYLNSCFKDSGITERYFDETVLYPDQFVYLNGNIAVNSISNKLNINTSTGEIIYKTDFSEAQTMEETLLAYMYVVNGVKKSGLPLKTMSEKDIDFIRNWESEAYRRSLVKDLKK